MKKDFQRIILGFIFLFITIMNCKAQTFPWAKNAIQSGSAEGFGVCTDPSGNVYITGEFSGSIKFGVYTLTNGAGAGSLFLTKYDNSGNVLWAKNANGVSTYGPIAYAVSTDAAGNVFVTGISNSPYITFGTYTLTNSGNYDLFLAKYDSNGNFLWAKSAIGSGDEGGASVSCDASGNSFITGDFTSPTLVFGSYTLTNMGSNDIYLAKYDPNGNVLWAKKVQEELPMIWVIQLPLMPQAIQSSRVL